MDAAANGSSLRTGEGSMKAAVAGVLILFVVFVVLTAHSCSQLSKALDACNPGVVTKESGGHKETTIECTKHE